MFRLDQGGYLIARISGIPIYGTVWLAIMIGLFALRAFMEDSLWALIWILTLFVSVLLHELGHAFAARRCGSTVLRITMHIFGGLMQHTGGSTWRQSIFISLAGPAVNVVLSAVAIGGLLIFDTGPGLSRNILTAVAIVNVVLLLFNVLPIYPLDGGQVARTLLDRRLRSEVAAYWGSIVSLVVLATAATIHVLTMRVSFLGLALMGMLAFQNVMLVRANAAVAKAYPLRWRTLFPPKKQAKGAKKAKGAKGAKKANPKRSAKRVKKLLKQAARHGLDSLEPEQRGVLIWHRTQLEQKVLDGGLEALTDREQALLDQHHDLARATAGPLN